MLCIEQRIATESQKSLTKNISLYDLLFIDDHIRASETETDTILSFEVMKHSSGIPQILTYFKGIFTAIFLTCVLHAVCSETYRASACRLFHTHTVTHTQIHRMHNEIHSVHMAWLPMCVTKISEGVHAWLNGRRQYSTSSFVGCTDIVCISVYSFLQITQVHTLLVNLVDLVENCGFL